jgi:hypothetical protein
MWLYDLGFEKLIDNLFVVSIFYPADVSSTFKKNSGCEQGEFYRVCWM